VDSRIIVRLKAKTQLGHRVVLCQALNLSFTGMFVATSMTFPVGSDVLFELMLPQARFPLEGEARVVRHSSGLREHSIGMGLTFLSFKHDGAEALRALWSGLFPPPTAKTPRQQLQIDGPQKVHHQAERG